MLFEYPNTLLLFWTLIPLVLLLIYARGRSVRFSREFIEECMFERLMPRASFGRWLLRSSLLVLSLSLLIFAGARPRFGGYFEETKRRGADIFILLDVSRSMLAEDVSPNRLTRAKSDIQDFLEQTHGDRIGLIAFAGQPRMLVPLTVDKGFFQEVFDDLSVDSIPKGGTEIGDAIRLAVRTFSISEQRDCAIVLITDGEDHGSFMEEAAKEAAARNIKIFTVALGDPHEGARIPLYDENGNRTYLKSEGREVWSKVDPEPLREIATLTRGAFVPAYTSVIDLGAIYQEQLSSLRHGEYQVERRRQLREQYQLFLFFGICALAAFLFIPGTKALEITIPIANREIPEEKIKEPVPREDPFAVASS